MGPSKKKPFKKLESESEEPPNGNSPVTDTEDASPYHTAPTSPVASSWHDFGGASSGTNVRGEDNIGTGVGHIGDKGSPSSWGSKSLKSEDSEGDNENGGDEDEVEDKDDDDREGKESPVTKCFDAVISCGASCTRHHVSPFLRKGAATGGEGGGDRVREKFAAKVLAVLSVQILIALIVTEALRAMSGCSLPRRHCLGVPPEFSWLPIVPAVLYFAILIVFRVWRHLSRKRIIKDVLAGSMVLLLIVTSSLFFTMYTWGPCLLSLLLTYLIMAAVLCKCGGVDLYSPHWVLYGYAFIISLIISFLCAIGVHLIVYQFVLADIDILVETHLIIVFTMVVTTTTVYELRMLLEGRRMDLNESEWFMAAVLL